MKTGNRSNAMLVELLIVILFFMLGSTLVMQVFEKAFSLSRLAGLEAQSLTAAQSLADRLSAAESWEEALESLGYVRTDLSEANTGWETDGQPAGLNRLSEESLQENSWKFAGSDTDTLVVWKEEKTEAGRLLDGKILISRGEEKLLELPCAQYLPDGDSHE